MNLAGNPLKRTQKLDTGRVRRFILPDRKIRVTQITTFCPDIIGPGPTHLYLIENDALVLLDTGIPTKLAKRFFYDSRNQIIPPEIEALPEDYSKQELLEGLHLAGHSIKDVDLLVITHGHPDHFLMGRWIVEQANCPVTAHALDTSDICNPWGMLEMWFNLRQRTMAMGMPQPKGVSDSNHFYMEDVNPESIGFSLKVDFPIMQEGLLTLNHSSLKGIEVKHLPGHSPGSVGLIVGQEGSEKVLLCGDVLLSPITPHPDDLLTYLRTLEKLKNLQDIVLALPAHGKVIRNVKARVDFLQKYHRQRLKITYKTCRKPCSAWDIATLPDYFDIAVDPSKFNPLAGNEALMHMEVLQMVQGLKRVSINKGVHLFQNQGEPFEEVYNRILDLVKDQRINPIMRY
ncbi:MAG: MBL fold metallo-hydrolase [Deltaproteobacteria bacterium]|nr:MBL fold metallo-hydrolase [Deltaproteobacteria bacterium]MBW2052220.1 MBL fold metallo-hydrolase [Deltaproteobacteria bacterium]MBW2141047.1 MBL fold metallo-hydrolase [Deltaproteobacteria bacterium]MBW2323478.1 MBL fold metallo-hydrolase [Deltaproteobacteria bacterium]